MPKFATHLEKLQDINSQAREITIELMELGKRLLDLIQACDDAEMDELTPFSSQMPFCQRALPVSCVAGPCREFEPYSQANAAGDSIPAVPGGAA
jgi:hypothetical protein